MKKIAPKKTPGKKPQNSVAEVERLKIVFPDDFWRKFYAGCFLASGHFSLDSAVDLADDLVKQMKQEKQC